MKLKLTKPAAGRPTERRWPGYLWGGRVRTSTVALIIAFAAVWWVYDTYRAELTPPAAPQVVPPGFIPDPAYTWVPRTRLQQPPVTVTETITPTPTTTEPTSEPEPPTPVPGFPFCPPLCPPPTPTPPEHPEQGPPPPRPPAESDVPGAHPPPAQPGPVTSAAPPGPVSPHPAAP